MPSSGTYRVTVDRSGQHWRVRVEDIDGPSTTLARDLADVEPRARRLVWAYTGINPDDIALDLDVRLPISIHVRLRLAEQLCEEATNELDIAIGELLDAGISLLDIGRILRRRGQTSSRAVSVANLELIDRGLARHPEAIGIQWDDHGRFLTRICRDCLERKEVDFLDRVSPDGECALVYEDMGCHFCESDDDRCATTTFATSPVESDEVSGWGLASGDGSE